MDYSPSETLDYIKCPMYWRLRKQWIPSAAEEWTPNQTIGSAIGKAFEIWLPENGRDADAALQAAYDLTAAEFVENDSWTLNAVQKLVRKGFEAALKTTIESIVSTEKVLAVELEIGRGRIDLVTRQAGNGPVIVTDHKIALQLKDYYLQKRLIESETSWQLWDYAARVYEYYGLEDDGIIIRTHQGVLTPSTKWHTQERIIPAELLKKWSEGRDIKWLRMQEDENRENVTMELGSCIDRYGRCEMYDACHTCRLDETKIPAFYTKKEK